MDIDDLKARLAAVHQAPRPQIVPLKPSASPGELVITSLPTHKSIDESPYLTDEEKALAKKPGLAFRPLTTDPAGMLAGVKTMLADLKSKYPGLYSSLYLAFTPAEGSLLQDLLEASPLDAPTVIGPVELDHLDFILPPAKPLGPATAAAMQAAQAKTPMAMPKAMNDIQALVTDVQTNYSDHVGRLRIRVDDAAHAEIDAYHKQALGKRFNNRLMRVPVGNWPIAGAKN